MPTELTEKQLLKLAESDKKKERKGFKLKDTEKHKQKDPLTPVDLVRAVFHQDPNALMKSFGSRGRARRKQFLEDKKKGKVLTRSFHRSRAGNVVMKEEIIEG